MEKEWHKIIAFNGSQEKAFEELVCQIARSETNDQFSSFERVGTPDGGVECYWKLRDGGDWGLQAKFYEQLRPQEYNSIKKSLFEAVETHPDLTRYFVCIPHNLADGRRGRNSQKTQWENYKAAWEIAFNKIGRKTEVIFWESSTYFPD